MSRVPERDLDSLQNYLDGTLTDAEAVTLEKRLKLETPLAQALLQLAQEEAVLVEWSATQAGMQAISAGQAQTSQARIPSYKQGAAHPPAGDGGAPRPQEARTMLMQANCPGCRAVLRIPAGWMHQPIRCKHCGMVIQLQQKAAPSAPPPAIPVGRAAAPAPPAMRVSPPAAIRVPPPPPPAAIRVPAPPPPVVAPRGTYDKAAPLIQPRAKNASSHKSATIAVWLVGLVVMGGIVFALTQAAKQIPEEGANVAAVDPEPPAPPPEQPKPAAPPKKRIGAPSLVAPSAEPVMTSEPKEQPKEEPKPKEQPKEVKTKSGISAPKASDGNEPEMKTTTAPKPPAPRPPVRPPITPPKNPEPVANTNPTPTPTQPRPVANTPRPPVRAIDVQPTATTMPRRLLAINPNNYLYYNPISYGSKLRDTHELVVRLTNKLGIPPSQVTEISDAAPTKPVPPLKPIVEKALADFCESSRAQDRIVILYSGHAVEMEEEIFLVPVEGDGTDKETLISLKSVFELLSKCKARQKVLILDVCRANSSRGAERPDSGKMGEKLDKILAEPPAGVQIWSACVKDQNSFEDGTIGALFLNAFVDALGSDSKGIILPVQNAGSKLPVEELADKVNKNTEADAKARKLEQTPRLAGEEITEGAAPPNASEPAATPVKVEWQFGTPIFGVASKAMIEGILKETAEIPPVKVLQDDVKPIRAETLPTFSSDLLKPYKAEEAGDSDFRKAVVKTTEILKKHARSFQEDFKTTSIDMLKTDVQTVQKSLATMKLEFEEALEEMTTAGEKREEEKNKRWQANYDYVLARLKMRIAYVFEYQYMLSEIRTDALPERPEGSPGWRLASREKMQCKGPEGKEAKKHLEEAKKLLEGLATTHAGTPWQVLGKREMFTNLGLEWQPIGGAAAEKGDKAEKAEK